MYFKQGLSLIFEVGKEVKKGAWDMVAATIFLTMGYSRKKFVRKKAKKEKKRKRYP